LIRKWYVRGLATCIVILMTTLPSARAISSDTPSTEGPSQDKTLAFIKDTWEACATMHSGWQRMTAKDGSLWHVDRMAKVDVIVIPPSALRLITRHNERRRLSGIFEIQTLEELIQAFDLNALSPNVSPERAGQDATLYGIRLVCARAACVTEWVASLTIPGKPLHDLKTGKLANWPSPASMSLRMWTAPPKVTRGRRRGRYMFPSATR
jgi:hypothetical protein